MIFRTVLLTVVLSAIAASAHAQSFEGGVHVSLAQWSEFDENDYGIGGRLTWKPVSIIGVDADVTWYPSEFPDGVGFSGSRVEGLFGATIGPRLNRIRPFAKAAVGFLKVAEPPEAIVCLAIFPPPMFCRMASGQTLQAFEIGGGLEVSTTASTFVRVDIADRVLHYPGPTLDRNFEPRDEGPWGHALRFTIGAGLRF
jgi:hypothetical protein